MSKESLYIQLVDYLFFFANIMYKISKLLEKYQDKLRPEIKDKVSITIHHTDWDSKRYHIAITTSFTVIYKSIADLIMWTKFVKIVKWKPQEDMIEYQYWTNRFSKWQRNREPWIYIREESFHLLELVRLDNDEERVLYMEKSIYMGSYS